MLPMQEGRVSLTYIDILVRACSNFMQAVFQPETKANKGFQRWTLPLKMHILQASMPVCDIHEKQTRGYKPPKQDTVSYF